MPYSLQPQPEGFADVPGFPLCMYMVRGSTWTLVPPDL
uniref:Putative preoptic regulatory factor 1 n=1 Tax=Rattus norvegicus TaxID=10116 RepID=PORF1_RAT|nr:RecName: Full=Putative preoptic regulatory factor 1; Short=PORF-1; Flags: Precursor [Rattus norvegicus]CAA37323.1 unnamed protein product [Rattus norvegicus]